MYMQSQIAKRVEFNRWSLEDLGLVIWGSDCCSCTIDVLYTVLLTHKEDFGNVCSYITQCGTASKVVSLFY